MRLYEKPAHVLHDMLVNKEITSVELTEDVLARIDEVEGDVKAYLTITRDEALAQAKAKEGMPDADGINAISADTNNTRILLRIKKPPCFIV